MNIRTRIKICGIATVEDAVETVNAGVDAIGLNFVPASPRAIDLERAKAISAVVPAFVSRVALFANAGVAEVQRLCAALMPDLLQFHGNEEPSFCTQFARPYVRAWRVSQHASRVGDEVNGLLESFALFDSDPWCRGHLLDAPATKGYAGHAQPFDWSLVPTDRAGRLIVAGGLTPENVGALVRTVGPYAVDVSSGVESAPGVKDHDKIHRFVEAVRLADHSWTNKNDAN